MPKTHSESVCESGAKWREGIQPVATRIQSNAAKAWEYNAKGVLR